VRPSAERDGDREGPPGEHRGQKEVMEEKQHVQEEGLAEANAKASLEDHYDIDIAWKIVNVQARPHDVQSLRVENLGPHVSLL
jgi:hypothetical protein